MAVSGPDKPQAITPLASIIAVTGIQAAGKTTVSRLLAQRFERSVHIEADVLQQMIVSGGEWPSEPGVLTPEAERQLRLRLRNACLLARSFHEAGFDVILDDIILGERWGHLQSDLAGLSFTLVVLCPDLETVAQRDGSRGKRPSGDDWARYLDALLRETTEGVGLWIDNSGQSPEQTADEIMWRLRSGSEKAPEP